MVAGYAGELGRAKQTLTRASAFWPRLIWIARRAEGVVQPPPSPCLGGAAMGTVPAVELAEAGWQSQ